VTTVNRSTHDVIVVGARCAGSATAMLLARRGLRVLVLDRARYGSDTVSTHALMRGGVLQLQRWGLLDAIVAAGTPPVTRVVFHYPDEITPISLKPAAGVTALYAPRRTVLDRVLADAALAAGADLRFGVTVTELLRDNAGRVTGVGGRDADGERLLASAPLTVGADGIRSLVAREAGAQVIRTARSAGTAVLYGYWDGLPANGYEWLYAPGAAAGLIPTNEGQTLVFAGTTPTQMKAARRGETTLRTLKTLLETVSPAMAERVSAAKAPRWLRGFVGMPGFVRQPWGPGWALVGDAGFYEDPLSTHGITDALRDAELLADTVFEIHSGASTEAAALTGYQQTRDALARRLFGTVDAIASLTWTVPQVRRLLLEASSAMSEQVEALQQFGQHDQASAAVLAG
jgi:flavin-dependent dehydrogenase